MEDLRGRYREFDVQVGGSTAVLAQTYVEKSLRRGRRRKNDDLRAARGAVNALLISLAFWVALGMVLFTFF